MWWAQSFAKNDGQTGGRQTKNKLARLHKWTMATGALPLTKDEWKATAKGLEANPEKAITVLKAHVMSDQLTKLSKIKQSRRAEVSCEPIDTSCGYNPKGMTMKRDDHHKKINKCLNAAKRELSTKHASPSTFRRLEEKVAVRDRRSTTCCLHHQTEHNMAWTQQPHKWAHQAASLLSVALATALPLLLLAQLAPELELSGQIRLCL